MRRYAVAGTLTLGLAVGCAPEPPQDVPGVTVFRGARLIDGTGSAPVEDSVLVVRDGRVGAAGPVGEVEVPEGAAEIDVSGKTVVPGLIVTHAHVGGSLGLESGPEVYTRENLLDQLALYARYGVTTVNSLGGDGPEAIALRDAQRAPDLDRARILVAGPVVTAATPQKARAEVDEVAAMGADFVKIRVDDNLGRGQKMPAAVYQAVIDQAHQKGLPVAAHIYYLEDAKGLLRAGVDFIAHSVRDREVDQELIDLLKENDVCYSPTLTREVSTFVYEDVPEFFDDPFFLKEADPEVLAALRSPERQREARESGQPYKKALEVARSNLKKLADAGVTIAFGTDTGPPARFQGYFEHMELAMMADAGLDPMAVLRSAAGDAARCIGLEDVGTLEPGKWADFIVLEEDPLADIENTRTIESVWIAGNRVPERGQEPSSDSTTDSGSR